MIDTEIKAKLAEDIKEILGEELSIEPEKIDLDEDVVEYGVDSLTVALFIDDLNDKLGVEITPAIMFGSENLNEIINLIMEEYGDEVRGYYEAQA